MKLKIYKYVPFGDGAKAILRDNTMKYSSKTEFNDPFDCIAKFDKHNTLKELPRSEQHLKEIMGDRSLSPSERFRAKRLAQREMGKLLDSNYFESMTNDIGISCFSKVYDNILMWSHYADKHTGIVIEFSTNQIHKLNSHNAENQLLGFDVEYERKMPVVGNVLAQDFERDVKPLIFTKAKDWLYEQEFRVVSCQKGVGIHKFDGNLISKVFIGVNFDSSNLDELKQLVSNLSARTGNNIPIVTLNKSETEYELQHA